MKIIPEKLKKISNWIWWAVVGFWRKVIAWSKKIVSKRNINIMLLCSYFVLLFFMLLYFIYVKFNIAWVRKVLVVVNPHYVLAFVCCALLLMVLFCIFSSVSLVIRKFCMFINWLFISIKSLLIQRGKK